MSAKHKQQNGNVKSNFIEANTPVRMSFVWMNFKTISQLKNEQTKCVWLEV